MQGTIKMDDETNQKVIILPVSGAFLAGDSITIKNLLVKNKTSIHDVSSENNIILLYGEYGSNDYIESNDDVSLLIAAPRMQFSTNGNITVKGGVLDSLSIPDIIIYDDDIHRILEDSTTYELSFEGDIDYQWSGDICDNDEIDCEDNLIKIKWGVEDSLVLNNLIIREIELQPDRSYQISLSRSEDNQLISQSIDSVVVGLPTINLDVDKIWVDLDSIKNVNILSINESINQLKSDSIKLYFDNDYLEWDTSIVQDFDFDYVFNDDSLIITNYSPGSESKLDLSLFDFFMPDSVIENIKLEDSLVVLNCEFIDEYNKFKITESLTLHFDPLISDKIPFSGSTLDSLYLTLTLNSNFSDPNSTINNPVILFVTDDSTYQYDLEIDLSNLSGGISQVEFLFPNTLLETLSSLQEYNNVDLYFSLSDLNNDNLGRNMDDTEDIKLTPISLGWGEGIKNIKIEDTDRYLNPDSNNIVFTLDGTVAGTSRVQLQNLITDTMYVLNSVNINNSTIEIPGAAIRNSLGDDADGIYDIIVQKIDNGYSFPFIKRLIIDTQPALYRSVVPTTDIFNEVWDSNSIHSVTDNDEIIFTFWNYPYHIKEDSVIIFSDETTIPFELTGFQFNDSLDIDVKITMIDSLGDSIFSPTFNQTAVNGMYEFEKQLYIELSDRELQGADTLIIQYTATDWAGNISIHKIKYDLFTEDDISGLVDRIFNYPNPFGSVDGGTQVRYILTNDAQNGKYVIFDAKGELVYHYSLSENDLLKGTHTMAWSGKYLNDKYVLATGVYFGFLDIDDTVSKHKLVIMN